MVERIRRNRRADADRSGIDALMKSISKLQDRMAADAVALRNDSTKLHSEMKAAGLTSYVADMLLAELIRSAGRSVKTIDPKAFRKLVKDDKDFYACISVSTTAAKKVLPEKQLIPITATKDAVPGEETVRVMHLSDEGR